MKKGLIIFMLAITMCMPSGMLNVQAAPAKPKTPMPSKYYSGNRVVLSSGVNYISRNKGTGEIEQVVQISPPPVYYSGCRRYYGGRTPVLVGGMNYIQKEIGTGKVKQVVQVSPPPAYQPYCY